MHLLLVPIAALTNSTLNFSDPSSLWRFWDYVTIKQLGGSFLLELFPRKSPIWSAQTMNVLRVLGHDFLNAAGRAGALGLLPAVAAAWGVVALWRGNRRFAAALATVLLLQIAFTVLYFNIPPNYFRTFDRHYLPIGVTIGVLVACGLGAAMERAVGAAGADRVRRVGGGCSCPATQLWNNWSTRDASRRYFARDYAANALLSLPPNAIYFTVGDNDTFPVMYLQSVEGVRPDVTIINLSVANVPRWPDQLTKRDPSFPLSLSLAQRTALVARPWTDTIALLPIHGTAEAIRSDAGSRAPRLAHAAHPTAIRRPHAPGRDRAPRHRSHERVETTATFAITGGEGAMEWLKPYGHIEELYSRIVPVVNALADPRILRAHLFDVARYRGFADSSVAVDGVSRTMAFRLRAAPHAAFADAAAGALDACRPIARAARSPTLRSPDRAGRVSSADRDACVDPVKY